MAKFVDTTRMGGLIGMIEGDIRNINSFIDAYSTAAPSLGTSSFRGSVEANLGKIPTTYHEVFDSCLTKLQDTLNEVKEAYDLSATKVEDMSL